MAQSEITASAPGRICLFGEHQDYLGLPVIAMAVDRRFRITYRPGAGSRFLIHTPDLPDRAAAELDIHAEEPRSNDDYCWGIARVLLEEGFRLPKGGELVFRSDIPFRAGCSSSSAMSAAWMRLLIEIGEHPDRASYVNHPERVARLVYRGEKELFQGSGGMMDQYSCYLGGLVYVFRRANESLEGAVEYGVEHLPCVPEDLILIDSGQPKDTQGVLSSVSGRARAAVESASRVWPDFRLDASTISEFDRHVSEEALPSVTRAIVRDHLINRDLCQRGLAMLRSTVVPEEMGTMLNEEHRILSQTLGVSTPRIDELQKLCNQSGALGGKINGSGGGGTLFTFAPGSVAAVQAALDEAGARHHKITLAPGARIEKPFVS
ncbi:MAG: hypothetical protein H7A21_11275 [Spirochaetales bacterium]|nr:hypothetical protein [Leptospiraceae bacterium]MCP5482007.1 hypothetical protein [Spirochaetales bacterium]MCP5486488.1 hypothetical protein [Spirochaetales bacterium]